MSIERSNAVTHIFSKAQPNRAVPEGPIRLLKLKDGRAVALRVARRDDAPAVQQFVRGLSESSRRNRFFAPLRELSPDQLDRVTYVHPPNGLALVGETVGGPYSRIVALAQYVAGEADDAEFAVVVDDAWQRKGLGIQLLEVLTEHAARAGVEGFAGFVLADNWPMLALLARLDYELMDDDDLRVVRAIKRLDTCELVV